MSHNKSKNIEKLRNSEIFPNQLIDKYKREYDDLVKEKDKEIDSLKNEIKKETTKNGVNSNIKDLFNSLSFDQKYYLYSIKYL